MTEKSQPVFPPDSVWPLLGPLVALLVAPVLVGWVIAEPGAVPAELSATHASGEDSGRVVDWRALASVLVQVVLSGGLLWTCRRHYLQLFPWRYSSWSFAWGVVGVALWVMLCEPQWESHLLARIGLGGLLPERAAVDPFSRFSGPAVGWFLSFRLVVLALLVPLAEELFVRGWLVRYLEAKENWDVQSLTGIGLTAQLGVLAYAVLTHPQEAVAAVAWFSLVNWWMKRTGNFWDCAIVHAVTNGLLGVWILYSGQWRLW